MARGFRGVLAIGTTPDHQLEGGAQCVWEREMVPGEIQEFLVIRIRIAGGAEVTSAQPVRTGAVKRDEDWRWSSVLCSRFTGMQTMRGV